MATNGTIERLAWTFKQAMKSGEGNSLSFQYHLQNFLMLYQSTPSVASTNMLNPSISLSILFG